MVGIVVINVCFRREGGTLGTWYVVCLISLKSLVQILRACDIDYSQSREWMGSSGMSRSLSGRSERLESGTEDNRNLSIIEFLGLVVAMSAAKCD